MIVELFLRIEASKLILWDAIGRGQLKISSLTDMWILSDGHCNTIRRCFEEKSIDFSRCECTHVCTRTCVKLIRTLTYIIYRIVLRVHAHMCINNIIYIYTYICIKCQPYEYCEVKLWILICRFICIFIYFSFKRVRE